MRNKQVLPIMLALILFLTCTQQVYASSAQPAQQSVINNSQESTAGNTAIDIISYGVYGIEKFMGKDRVNGHIEFQNNSEQSVQLICFGFDGYDKDGTKIISSQNNTNDLGKNILSKETISVKLTFPANLAALQLKIDKYVTFDGKEHQISSENQVALDFVSLIKEVRDNSEKQANINIAATNSITITRYSSFLIAGTTPAIKVTLLNNTQTTVSDVQAKIRMNGVEMTYNAKQRIDSGKEVTHSGWGLAVGVKSIEIAIISYTTIDGEKYVVPQDKIQWKHIDL